MTATPPSASSARKQPAVSLKYRTKGRGKVYDSIIDTVGDTPLVRLNAIAKDAGAVATVYAKLEFFNPLASVKDRLALGMVEDAETSGRLTKDTVLVEPTSGNTGIALAFVAAAKGYKLVLTMPESFSIERRKMLKLLGAELELTPAAQGMKGAIARAEEIVASRPNALMLQQFQNNANSAIHRNTTAEEIWADTKGVVDVFVAGVGTGGTIEGTGEVLKQRNPAIKLVAVEPSESPVLSGGTHHAHKIQGIGAGFIPGVLDPTILDEVMQITNDEAFVVARKLAKMEGIPGGISSGATVAAALKIAARPEMKGKTIVVIVASFAERYLSTELFNDV